MPNIATALMVNEFIRALDGRRAKELSESARFLIKTLFGEAEEEEEIACKKIEGREKPNIEIRYKGATKLIALKTGSSRIVHAEYLPSIEAYLQNFDVPQRHLDFLRRWAAEEGHLSPFDKLVRHKSEIASFNSYFEARKDIQIGLFERAIFKGTPRCKLQAEAIYYGDLKSGFPVFASDLLLWVRNKDFQWIHNPHIGPLLIAAKGSLPIRSSQSFEKTPIAFRWAGVGYDLTYVRAFYHRKEDP